MALILGMDMGLNTLNILGYTHMKKGPWAMKMLHIQMCTL